MQFVGFRVILKRIQAIPFLLRDKTVPFRKKLLIILGIVYLFVPIDLIPFIPLDDVILLGVIIWYLRKELDKYWLGDDSGDLSKKFKRSKMVDGVDFKVYEGGAEENDPKHSRKGEHENPEGSGDHPEGQDPGPEED
ncbi:MAG: YkvA family protein [Anaerovoracaceae bacterium]|jgi:uncharacterized membrane protein YkvA (DUF1232 family)